MKKIILILLLFLTDLIYSSVIYINNEDEIKKYAINVSTVSKNVFIIPADLLANLSDENKLLINKMKSSGNAEFASTTFTEVILPVLMKVQLTDDVNNQIKRGKDIYRQVFDKQPNIFYPYMGIISKEMIEIVRQNDYTTFITSAGSFFDLKSTMTIIEPNLSFWTDAPVQNLAWNYLKKARTKISEYTSSNSYENEKLEAVLEEIYSLEKPIWFENYISCDEDKKRENDLWFRAGLSNIYRIIGLEPPLEISIPLFISLSNSSLLSSTTSEYNVYFNDEIDDVIPSSCNIISFGVKKSTTDIIFDLFISSQESEVVDIYIDMNKKNNAGSTSFLQGHKGYTDTMSAWEYAISISNANAYLYRYNRSGNPMTVGIFNIEKIPKEKLVKLKIPEKYIRGNPGNWGYIVVGFLPSGDIFDVLGKNIFQPDSIIQIPALRVK